MATSLLVALRQCHCVLASQSSGRSERSPKVPAPKALCFGAPPPHLPFLPPLPAKAQGPDLPRTPVSAWGWEPGGREVRVLKGEAENGVSEGENGRVGDGGEGAVSRRGSEKTRGGEDRGKDGKKEGCGPRMNPQAGNRTAGQTLTVRLECLLCEHVNEWNWGAVQGRHRSFHLRGGSQQKVFIPACPD